MSLSAVSDFQISGLPGSLVPQLATENATSAAEARSASAKNGKHLAMFGEGDDSPSFWDLLDVINPLQHIPLVNNLYREATDDKIGVAARLVGGTLFGGPLGLIGAVANCVLEESTGNDAGGHVLALFRDDAAPAGDTGTALASAAPSPAAPPPPQQLAALPAAKEAPAAPPVSDDAAKAQPLILSDLVGGEPPAPAAAPVRTVASAAAPMIPVAADAAQPAATAAAATAQRPMPLGREQRFMPIPGRTTPLATQSPPAVGTTVSATGLRSNAPIAGTRTSNNRVASPAMVQQMAAAQGATTAQAGSAGDWFSASMIQAMDKYERGARLGRPSGSTIAEP